MEAPAVLIAVLGSLVDKDDVISCVVCTLATNLLQASACACRLVFRAMV
jgi:hypothetical protein